MAVEKHEKDGGERPVNNPYSTPSQSVFVRGKRMFVRGKRKTESVRVHPWQKECPSVAATAFFHLYHRAKGLVGPTGPL